MPGFSYEMVNRRFKRVYEKLLEEQVIQGKSDLAQHLETYNHVINSILKGKRNLTVKQMGHLFDAFRVNANYLFGLSEEMFLLDRHSNNITLVPQQAQAGYAQRFDDQAFLDGMKRFSLPDLQNAAYIAFEVNGDSMLPNLADGDVVICEDIDASTRPRDNHMYVVVTDLVVVKRVQSIREGDEITGLRLISDNSAAYRPYDVRLEDVRQLLEVRSRVTKHAIG
ncbi:MAG: S24 family peptidase [Bacteroidetes bacterium]|nr:S24 family peptidase [Bacteroidota bacterium]